jgi:hypothetical protein
MLVDAIAFALILLLGVLMAISNRLHLDRAL